MSAVGYPDYQKLSQWLGAPLVQGTGVVIGAGTHVDAAIEAANFASVIVALKATGGNVTVRVKQTVPGGPASLVLTQDVIVVAGATLFEAFVLFGSAVELDLIGTLAGTSVDYALYGSNTTTNAQVITQATINVQKAGVLVAAEPTLDLLDGPGIKITAVDDPTNTRILLTIALAAIADTTLLAAAALIDIQNIPQTFAGLKASYEMRSDGAASPYALAMIFNNDSAAHYGYQYLRGQGAAVAAGSLTGSSGEAGVILGSTALAQYAGHGEVLIPNYAATDGRLIRGWVAHSAAWDTNPFLDLVGGAWTNSAAINRLTFFPGAGNFVIGSRLTLDPVPST